MKSIVTNTLWIIVFFVVFWMNRTVVYAASCANGYHCYLYDPVFLMCSDTAVSSPHDCTGSDENACYAGHDATCAPCGEANNYCRWICDSNTCAGATTCGAQACGSTTKDCSCTNDCGGTNTWTVTGLTCRECGPTGCGVGAYDCSNACKECGPYETQSCGDWTQTYDCSGNVSGCKECEACTIKCGQSRDCNANCASTDTGNPSSVTPQSPLGLNLGTAKVINDTTAVSLTWVANTDSLTDSYDYKVSKVGSPDTLLVDKVIAGKASTNVGVTGSYDNAYYWAIKALNTTCSSTGVGRTYASTWSSDNYFRFNRTPIFSNQIPGANLILQNYAAVVVPIENTGTGVSGNQSCQSIFGNINNMNFVLTVGDSDGGDEISQVSLMMNDVGGTRFLATIDNIESSPVSSISGAGVGFTGGVTLSAINGTSRSVTFPIHFDNNYTYLSDLLVRVIDIYGADSEWIDTRRYLKVWDCQVPSSGSLFDSSDVIQSCPVSGYTNLATAAMNFQTLNYNLISGINGDVSANPVLPASHNETLYWGSQYNPVFNADINGSTPLQRIISLDVAVTSPICSTTVSLDQAKISAYTNNPRLQIDYSSVRNQDAWYQVSGAGIGASNTILDSVPPTCPLNLSCTPAVSISNASIGNTNNGLVAGRTLSNNSGCSSCSLSNPTNWNINKNVFGDKITYAQLYESYNRKLGLGYTGTLGAGSTGVVFVNGDLNINSDIVVATTNPLIVVVSGKITINQLVNRVDGIYVADGDIVAAGNSTTQLGINGSLYSSSGDISLTRSYTNPANNNTSPAVLVTYRPDLLINIPGSFAKVLSGFREGN